MIFAPTFIIYNPLMNLPIRKKNRMEWYDYSAGWWYFVTICADNRLHYFWEIVDGQMILNTAWHIVYDARASIPNFYDNHVDIHDFVIMPNHTHGIIITDGLWPSLSTIIKSYKGFCSKQIRPHIPTFARQKSFHDRIIRDQQEYERIIYYIQTNPQNRQQDKRYTV